MSANIFAFSYLKNEISTFVNWFYALATIFICIEFFFFTQKKTKFLLFFGKKNQKKKNWIFLTQSKATAMQSVCRMQNVMFYNSKWKCVYPWKSVRCQRWQFENQMIVQRMCSSPFRGIIQIFSCSTVDGWKIALGGNSNHFQSFECHSRRSIARHLAYTSTVCFVECGYGRLYRPTSKIRIEAAEEKTNVMLLGYCTRINDWCSFSVQVEPWKQWNFELPKK